MLFSLLCNLTILYIATFEFFINNGKSKELKNWLLSDILELSIRDRCNDPDISFNDVVQCMYIAGDIWLVIYVIYVKKFMNGIKLFKKYSIVLINVY